MNCKHVGIVCFLHVCLCVRLGLVYLFLPPVCSSDLPYSKASRAVFPLWEELAEALKDREDVVVARIDASANDINMSMQGTYPSLCLFPALHVERVRTIQ